MANGTQDEARRRETEIEAAVFRRLRDHLRARADVQNLDLMNLAGFCRNCLSTWYAEASAERGAPVDKAASREIVYGMPYEEWRERHQREADPAALEAFASAAPHRDGGRG